MNPDLFPDIVSASGALEAAHQQLYRAHWSTKVLVELERNLRQSGRSDNYIQRLCATMNEAFPEAVVDIDEDLARSLACDPKDRHVLAAAISSRCEILATLNTKDFPTTATALFGVEVIRPDDFLLDLFELSRPRMMACLEAVANRHKRFPMHTGGDASVQRIESGGPGVYEDMPGLFDQQTPVAGALIAPAAPHAGAREGHESANASRKTASSSPLRPCSAWLSCCSS